MSEQQHTPGPWVVATTRYTNEVGVVCVEHPTFDAIDVLMPRWSGAFQEHQANAHVIAAAPDLLGACKLALTLLEEFVQGAEDAHEQLRAAIAKAEGK